MIESSHKSKPWQEYKWDDERNDEEDADRGCGNEKRREEIVAQRKTMKKKYEDEKTRPDTRLPKSRAGGQGSYLRPLYHLGRSSKAKDRKNPKKVKCDGQTDGPTDRRTVGCIVR